MKKVTSLVAALLTCAALTSPPAIAADPPDPVKATADFQEALFTPVAGVLDFEETADGIKVAGEFKKGFASDLPSDYQLVVLDNAEVILDFTKDFQKVAKIEAAEVTAFEFITTTTTKIADIRNEDVVVRQLVNVAAGIKVQTEIGRAKVQKTEV